MPEFLEVEIAERGAAHEKVHLRAAVGRGRNLVAIHGAAENGRLAQTANNRFEFSGRHVVINRTRFAGGVERDRNAVAIRRLRNVTRARSEQTTD